MKKLEKKTSKNIRPNLYDYLKVFAIIAMIIDHIGYYLYPELEVLRWIGRFAFPIFLFLVGFNGKYTWSWKVFYSALMVQCAMRAMLFYTGAGSFTLNILFSILLARGILAHLVSKLQKKDRGFLIFCILFFACAHPYLSQILDYWSLGFFFAFAWMIARYYSYYFRVVWLVFIWLLVNTQVVFRFWDGSFLNPQVIGLALGFSVLILLFYLLYKNNLPLKTWSFLDRIILWISRYAIWIYVGHILILLIWKILWEIWYLLFI